MKTNYHSHTKWCKHGVGEIEDYILEAINKKIEIYGVSEHIPFKNTKNSRMDYEQLDEFMAELEFMKNKYKDKITILKGLECEYFEEYHDYYIHIKEKYNIDYLILGHHWKDISFSKDFFINHTKEDIQDYEKGLIKGINSGLFDFIAHPDIYINVYPFNDDAKAIAHNIFKICEEVNMPVEINANGLRENKGYPNWEFWELSKNYKLTYLINSDCHDPRFVLDEAVIKTYEKAKKLNIDIPGIFGILITF